MQSTPLAPNNFPAKVPAKRKHWTAEEDEAIRAVASKKSSCKWSELAAIIARDFGITGRTAKQCRERWYNHLDPLINNQPWSVPEQQLLFNAHAQLGNTWAHITSLIPGRSENAVKNMFYSSLRRQYKKWKGSEPLRHQLKKHDRILTGQILTALNKKLKHKLTREEPPEEQSENLFTLDEIRPLAEETEKSLGSTEPDFFFTDFLFDCL